jgi:hypothetical protein
LCIIPEAIKFENSQDNTGGIQRAALLAEQMQQCGAAALSLAASLCQAEEMHMKAPTRKSGVATFLHMELYNIKKK